MSGPKPDRFALYRLDPTSFGLPQIELKTMHPQSTSTPASFALSRCAFNPADFDFGGLSTEVSIR
jgi:hypothetical protein